QSGFLSEARDGASRKFRMCVETRADRRSAKRQLAELRPDVFQPRHAVGDLAGVTAELLSQPDGCRILQVRAPDLEDVVELFRFSAQRLLQFNQRRDQLKLDARQRRQMEG